MSIIGSNILAGASGQAGYNLNNSLRFRLSNSAYLSRTPSASNRTTWTWSAWVKRGTISSASTQLHLITPTDASANDAGTTRFYISADVIKLTGYTSTWRVTTQVFRDPSAWYHIVLVWDTTQATAANRIKMYVNGSEITAFTTNNNPTQNATGGLNAATATYIGANPNSGPTEFFDGYMTEINFVDGQALTPSSFGETSLTTGSWIPKKYTGTYGTNGFKLNFSDTSAATAAAIGKDSSGNGNNWTPSGISVTAGVTYDAMIDVPTNTSATVANYCVLSPLNYRTYTGSVVPTISNANLTVTQASTVASCIGTATMGVTASGKYYWEATFVSGSGSNNSFLGVVAGQLQNTSAADLGYYSNEYAYMSGNGNKYTNNTSAAYGSSYTSGDVIGFALDLDAGTLTFYKNNTSQGVAFSSLSASETYFPAFDTYYNNTFAYNFGQRPFTYTPPTGFVRLNTYNLPTPTILQGNKYMDATLYTGDATSPRSIANSASFKPDFVWVKNRTLAGRNHQLFDSVRGANKGLYSNLTNAESTTTQDITAFNSNGFTVGNDNNVNSTGDTFVGWQWQAGQGTTTAGTGTGGITSVTQSVNTTAGFSVVTYTGSGTAGTVTHGLGVAPSWVIVKRKDTTGDWQVRHTSIAAASSIQLNSTAAAASATTVWNSTAPSSTVFSVGTAATVNASAGTYVAYCWAAIAGYSAFGSYTGNGSADGSFVYTGFLPRFVMIKRTDTTGDWYIWDTARNTFDVITNTLLANSSAAETSATSIDALSNGFKLRNTTAGFNASGGTYIYAAFASNPFRNSNAF